MFVQLFVTDGGLGLGSGGATSAVRTGTREEELVSLGTATSTGKFTVLTSFVGGCPEQAE